MQTIEGPVCLTKILLSFLDNYWTDGNQRS